MEPTRRSARPESSGVTPRAPTRLRTGEHQDTDVCDRMRWRGRNGPPRGLFICVGASCSVGVSFPGRRARPPSCECRLQIRGKGLLQTLDGGENLFLCVEK